MVDGGEGSQASAEAGAAAAGAAQAAKLQAAGSQEDVAAKVVDFVRSVRGLNAFSGSDLDSLLYDWRFELLVPQALDGADGAEASRGIRLPTFDTIPSREEVHDVLLGGRVPGVHQCVAHVLYPDAVPWPKREGEEPEPPPEEQSSPPTAKGRASASWSTLASATSSTTAWRRRSHEGLRRFGAPMAGTLSEAAARAKRGPAMEVTLRGQAVTSTVLCGSRGAAREAQRDPLRSYGPEQDTSRLKAARDSRKELERTVKLEQYQERKLAEQVRDLEALRCLEEQHQVGLHRREEQRLAHSEELKRRLHEGTAQRLQEERATQQAEQEEREKEAKRERRLREQRARQKEAVKQWQTSRSESPRERRARSEQGTPRDARPLTERRKTQRMVEVEEATRAARLAAEERPPLPPPPRRHDLPSPRICLEAADAPGLQAPLGWRAQAKLVSSMFGLSGEEHAAVARHCTPVVPGPGRMGQYMASDRAKPG